MNTYEGEVSAEPYPTDTKTTYLLDTYPSEGNTGFGGARGRSTTEEDERK